ncbi:FadR/GntR family transcriptional regulator [Ammoniphilus sp. YIM 78166]|uniref:FadR/GntR family transcriptional regulator n=1 Tax=Ammoniphilus sp. YIM 78166 TaxID=1644106 RepID=UPI00106F239C|nr:FadR/GntR family transcriptional regulator [Ammoniphilus sp. YIM 78166]
MEKKEKISQKIARELLAMIERKEIIPGSKLPTEMELAARFGVSRLPVREALSVLRSMGVIYSQQGGGSYVESKVPPSFYHPFEMDSSDAESIYHLFEIRRILEPEAAYLAALRRTPEDLEHLRNVLEWLKDDFIADDKTGQEADFEFHRAIIQAAHNPMMTYMFENLSALHKKILQMTLRQNLGLTRKKQIVYKEHENIFLAIEAEEPELAKVQCLVHLKNVEKKLHLFLHEGE